MNLIELVVHVKLKLYEELVLSLQSAASTISEDTYEVFYEVPQVNYAIINIY